MEFLIFVKMSRFLVPQVECTLFLARRLHENDIVIYGARLHMCHTMSTELVSVCFFFVLRLQCVLLLFVSALTACRKRDTVSTILRTISSIQTHMHLLLMVCI